MKKIRVGLDFDGVVAYNPFRVVRYPVAYFKKNILGIKKLRFWYPKYHWQQVFWKILHESSVFPAKGVDLFKEMVTNGQIEAHLITARYSFLDDNLFAWLKKHKLERYFKSINHNIKDEQPHIFKERMVKKLGVEYYVEDNLDIVNYLSTKFQAPNTKQIQNPKSKIQKETKIYWIYNLMDRGISYPYKYPYLENALKSIINE